MLISIIVPVFNVKEYLERCLYQLVNQTYNNIEIIIVDDGSTDGSSEVCDLFQSRDSRVFVIHKENGGLSDARNVGLVNAKGDYVAFVDSDDYIDLDTFDRLKEYLLFNVDIVIGDAYIEGGLLDLSHKSFDGIVKGEEYLINALKEEKAPMPAWLNIYRRDFLLDNDLFFKIGRLHEDEEFTPRAFLKAEKVLYSNVCFYHYIIRDNSITTKHDKRKNAQDLYLSFSELSDIYKKLNNNVLKMLLFDTISEKYLSLYQAGKLYQYGKQYNHKLFILYHARKPKTIIKALLFSVSPSLYWHINTLIKTIV